MMYDSNIILVTKQRHINCILDDRVPIWVTTITSLLLAKWRQCPMSRCVTEAVLNRIDEIHISQQHLSTLGIETYTFWRVTRFEVI